MTIDEYKTQVAALPKAAHEMEHISNFGTIISGGFVLLASELRRGFDQVAVALRNQQPLDPHAAERRRKAELAAERASLQARLAELGGGDEEPEAA